MLSRIWIYEKNMFSFCSSFSFSTSILPGFIVKEKEEEVSHMSESIGYQPLCSCYSAPSFNITHKLLKQGTGTANHLTLLRISFLGISSQNVHLTSRVICSKATHVCVTFHQLTSRPYFAPSAKWTGKAPRGSIDVDEESRKTSDAGSQYCCGRVGRGFQPPSTHLYP